MKGGISDELRVPKHHKQVRRPCSEAQSVCQRNKSVVLQADRPDSLELHCILPYTSLEIAFPELPK